MDALRLWVRALFARRQVEDEMRREMRHHLDMEIADHVRRGMPEDEARRTALLAFGGVVRAEESVRDERRTRVIENLIGDVRYALRGFARKPGYALVVVGLLALGIGGNTALFSLLYHELISPLPFADGNRMVELQATGAQGTIMLPLDESLADAWRQNARAVEQVTIIGWSEVTLGDSATGLTRRAAANALPSGASHFIGIAPELGRDIEPEDTLPGAQPVALITDAMWRRDYGAARDVLGRPLIVDGVRHAIIGVVPVDYRMPFVDAAELFLARRPLPASPAATDLALRGDVEALAKLRPKVGVAQANREMSAIFARWSESPAAVAFASQLGGGVGLDAPRVLRAIDEVRPVVREMVLVLFGAVSLVLLIACANVANLLLVRAWSRQRELAVRGAMGASRFRLASQMLTESLLLAVIGAGAGVGVAAFTLRAMTHSALGQQVAGARLEPAVLGWCGLLAVATAMLFGSAPARFAAEGRVIDALKAGARSASAGAGARRFRATMVGLEIALSVTLLSGAGLLVRTLVAMQRADVGMDTRGLVSVQLNFPHTRLSDTARAAAVRNIQSRLAALPSVQSVSLSTLPAPKLGIGVGGLAFEDRPVNPSDSLAAVGFNDVEPAYFKGVGLRVLAGRVFAADPRMTGIVKSDEIMVNERFARRFWPNSSAVGKRIRYGKTWSTIVGVVSDVEIPGAKDRVKDLQLYMPIAGAPYQVAFVVRSSIPVSRLDAYFHAIAHEVSPPARFREAVVADEAVAKGHAVQRSMLILLGVFAGVALLLAAIGLHAVISFSVSQRTREIGMRLALGAESGDVIRLVLGQGLGITIVGVACGAMAAVAATRVLRSYLYGVQPGDPLTLAAVAVGLLLIAVIATLIPALRAARLDPVEALRAD